MTMSINLHRIANVKAAAMDLQNAGCVKMMVNTYRTYENPETVEGGEICMFVATVDLARRFADHVNAFDWSNEPLPQYAKGEDNAD